MNSMITFKKFILNEMPAALYKAAQQGDNPRFNMELQKAYMDLQSKLMNPASSAAAYRVEGASNFQIHPADSEYMYPYFTFDVDGREVKISVPNEENLTQIEEFVYEVDGERKTFGTTTADIAKRTGHIAPAVSYMLYGVKQAVHGGKRAKSRSSEAGMFDYLSKIPTDVLQKELERRLQTGFEPPEGSFDL